MKTVTVSTSQLLELASELAHYRMIDNLFQNVFNDDDIYIKDENGNLIYTDIAQDEFNHQYDYYLSTIENILK